LFWNFDDIDIIHVINVSPQEKNEKVFCGEVIFIENKGTQN
jgi:hypothetical protein